MANDLLSEKNMSFTREVITLQIGNYANYVGTHWWNIQVSFMSHIKTFSLTPKLNGNIKHSWFILIL